MELEIKKTEHAKLAPSASERWINCPGSIRLSEQVPEPPETEYAKEGSAAHELARLCLTHNLNANEYLGKTVIFDDGTWVVDAEMADGVQEYLDRVREIDADRTWVEQPVDVSYIFPGIFGTSDRLAHNSKTKKLSVIDLKYGKGVRVSAEWNSQLMTYALGALRFLESSGIEVDTVELIIIQPRIEEGFSSWEISSGDLIFWGLYLLRTAADQTKSEKAHLRVGDYCRFCPALAVCPAMVQHAIDSAKIDFATFITPNPEDLSDMEIVKIFELSELLPAWTTAVRSYFQRQMEEFGRKLPGYKLVPKKSNRAWKDEQTAIDTLVDLLGEAKAYIKTLVSPSQAEDRLKEKLKEGGIKRGFTEYYKQYIEPLWEKPDAGLTIAKSDDPRPAVDPQKNLIDFNEMYL